MNRLNKNIIAIFIVLSYSLYGFYGDGGGRSFIDFLMDKQQFRAQTDKIGVLVGLTNIRHENMSELVKIGFGFTGRTSGIILDNWTNDYKYSANLTTYLRLGAFIGLGYKSTSVGIALGYQYRWLYKDYQVHTPMLAFTALDNTLRFNFPLAIGIGKGDSKNTYILSTAIEGRYYIRTILDQIRLYIFYGYAKMGYTQPIISENQQTNVIIDKDDKSIYKVQQSVGFDLRFYFKFLKDSIKTNYSGEHIKFSVEPYFRFLFSKALKTLENRRGAIHKYYGNNYDITAYGYNPEDRVVAIDSDENFQGGYISSLPNIPSPQGQTTINDMYRVGLAVPLGLRVSSENYGLYLEPSLSLTLVNGKNISVWGNEKKGPFFTFGYVIYSEIYFTPIPELELYLEFQTGGATRWGNLDPAYSSGTDLIVNASCGITWYF